MKTLKKATLIGVFSLIASTFFAQVPQGFNYQAVPVTI